MEEIILSQIRPSPHLQIIVQAVYSMKELFSVEEEDVGDTPSSLLFCLKKLLTIAALEVLRQEEDRHPCSKDFSRIQLSSQPEAYFITGK